MLDVALFTRDDQIAEKVQRALSFASARVERLHWQPSLRGDAMVKPRDLIVLHPSHLDPQQRSDFECLAQLSEAAGVDRFLVEPFDEQHFGALVRALMRRRQGHVSSVTQYGSLSFDHRLKQLQVNGAEVDLTTREAQVMDVLLRRIGHIISKEDFVQDIDPDNMDLNSAAIEVYIHRLRKKVSADVLPIRNIKRCGYFLPRYRGNASS